MSEIEIEIGNVKDRVALHILIKEPTSEPLLLGFTPKMVDDLIETLHEAKERALSYKGEIES